MNYAMYLITSGGVEIPIPVMPEKLAVSSAGKNKTATVLELGEVLLLRKRGLRTVSWESFFPASSIPLVSGKRLEPMELVAEIQRARDSLKPLRFLLLGANLDVNTTMGIDDFQYEERGCEVGDVYYSIKLSEWINYAPKRLTLSGGAQAVEQPAKRSGTPEAPKTYTVVSGDSLWAIARRSYGDGGRWKNIYAANKSTVGANPNRIYPGQVLTLP